MPKPAILAIACLLVAGCYSPNVADGKLKCSTNGNKCPDGFHCATDGFCWKNGHDPTAMPDMTQPVIDMAQPVDSGADAAPPAVTAHKGTSILSGGVSARSEHYQIIMSTGQAPGGNANAASSANQKKAGLVGATQGK
jgi:hypothetical protein